MDDPDPEVRRQATLKYFEESAARSAAAAAAVHVKEEQRRRDWEAAHPREVKFARLAQRMATVVQAFLGVLFVADCVVLLAGVAHRPSYEPIGGGSLIVILLAIAGLGALKERAALRCARRARDS